MKIRNAQFAAVAAVALAMAGTASAQQPAAAPAQAPFTTSAPPIPGICVFSKDASIAGSKLGKYIEQRLDTLGKQTDAELQSTLTALQGDAKAVDGQRASLTQEQLEQKALELRQREANLQRLQQVRSREMQVTAGKALNRYDTELGPLVEIAVKEKNCAIVFGEGVVWANAAMDVTPAVIAKLDAKITEFAFDRERLDQQLAQGGAAPATTQPAATPARPAGAAPAARPRR